LCSTEPHRGPNPLNCRHHVQIQIPTQNTNTNTKEWIGAQAATRPSLLLPQMPSQSLFGGLPPRVAQNGKAQPFFFFFFSSKPPQQTVSSHDPSDHNYFLVHAQAVSIFVLLVLCGKTKNFMFGAFPTPRMDGNFSGDVFAIGAAGNFVYVFAKAFVTRAPSILVPKVGCTDPSGAKHNLGFYLFFLEKSFLCLFFCFVQNKFCGFFLKNSCN
jgi:hypothetical protein